MILLDLDPRYIRVLLAADAATRDTAEESWPDRYDELCAACEHISDEELASMRSASQPDAQPAETEKP